ncbi:unnamed protein product [Orchesella dallaii]
MPKYVSVREYFSGSERLEYHEITWAHAVNSHEALSQAIKNPNMMMLEADIMLGKHKGAHSHQMTPIMAHPPDKESDLSFPEFLDAVIHATQSKGYHKGIKLDFKDIEAVEPCLLLLKEKLGEENVIPFPVVINADILMGPVNSTKKPVDAERFITLAKTLSPYATMSLGWTTRFGHDDEKLGKGTGEIIHEGKYTISQIKEMATTIRKYAGDPPIFKHITFPVRAALAANSVNEIENLQGKMRSEFSITLWSAKDDQVDVSKVESMINSLGARFAFIDVPFRMEYNAKHFQNEESHIEPDDQPSLHALEAIPARGHSEEETTSETDKGTPSATTRAVTFLPVITLGLLAAFIMYRRL